MLEWFQLQESMDDRLDSVISCRIIVGCFNQVHLFLTKHQWTCRLVQFSWLTMRLLDLLIDFFMLNDISHFNLLFLLLFFSLELLFTLWACTFFKQFLTTKKLIFILLLLLIVCHFLFLIFLFHLCFLTLSNYCFFLLSIFSISWPLYSRITFPFRFRLFLLNKLLVNWKWFWMILKFTIEKLIEFKGFIRLKLI